MPSIAWNTRPLDDGVLLDPASTAERLVVWLPAASKGGARCWERISTLPSAGAESKQGLLSLAAVAVIVRQEEHGLLSRLAARFRRATTDMVWMLPNGLAARQEGKRKTGLCVVWPESGLLDEDAVRAHWPESGELRRLGPSLFAIAGMATEPDANARQTVQMRTSDKKELPPAADPSREIGERLLAEARVRGDRRQEITALIDLGFLSLRAGEGKRTFELLAEALGLSQSMGDRELEADALGYLAAAALEAHRPDRARECALAQLKLTRQTGDAFGEKLALERLGKAWAGLGDHAQSLSCFEQARARAAELGDGRHEAELLWLLATEHAELGRPEQALAHAQASVHLWRGLGSPVAEFFAKQIDESASIHESGFAANWLKQAMSAARAAGKFLGSGLKTVGAEVHRQRLGLCAACPHHTGLRCRLCGCFTRTKAWLPHEDCPLKKWPNPPAPSQS